MKMKIFSLILIMILLSGQIIAEEEGNDFESNNPDTWKAENINQVSSQDLANNPSQAIKYWDNIENKEELFKENYEGFKDKANDYFKGKTSGKNFEGFNNGNIKYDGATLTNGGATLNVDNFPAGATGVKAIPGGGFEFTYENGNKINLESGELNKDGIYKDYKFGFSDEEASKTVTIDKDGVIHLDEGASVEKDGNIINAGMDGLTITETDKGLSIQGNGNAILTKDNKGNERTAFFGTSLEINKDNSIKGENAVLGYGDTKKPIRTISGKFEVTPSGNVILELWEGSQKSEMTEGPIRIQQNGLESLAVITPGNDASDINIKPGSTLGGIVKYDEDSNKDPSLMCIGVCHIEVKASNNPKENLVITNKEPSPNIDKALQALKSNPELLSNIPKDGKAAVAYLKDNLEGAYFGYVAVKGSEHQRLASGFMNIKDKYGSYESKSKNTDYAYSLKGTKEDIYINGKDNEDWATLKKNVETTRLENGFIINENLQMTLDIRSENGKVDISNLGDLQSELGFMGETFLVSSRSTTITLGDNGASFDINSENGVKFTTDKGDSIDIIRPDFVRSSVGDELLDFEEEMYNLEDRIAQAKANGEDTKQLEIAKDNIALELFYAEEVQTLLDSGEYDAAVEATIEYMWNNPDSKATDSASLKLGGLLLKSADNYESNGNIDQAKQLRDQAIAQYNEVISDSDTSTAAKSNAYLGIATAYANSGEWKKSLNALYTSQENDPYNEYTSTVLAAIESKILNGLSNERNKHTLETEAAYAERIKAKKDEKGNYLRDENGDLIPDDSYFGNTPTDLQVKYGGGKETMEAAYKATKAKNEQIDSGSTLLAKLRKDGATWEQIESEDPKFFDKYSDSDKANIKTALEDNDVQQLINRDPTTDKFNFQSGYNIDESIDKSFLESAGDILTIDEIGITVLSFGVGEIAVGVGRAAKAISISLKTATNPLTQVSLGLGAGLTGNQEAALALDLIPGAKKGKIAGEIVEGLTETSVRLSDNVVAATFKKLDGEVGEEVSETTAKKLTKEIEEVGKKADGLIDEAGEGTSKAIKTTEEIDPETGLMLDEAEETSSFSKLADSGPCGTTGFAITGFMACSNPDPTTIEKYAESKTELGKEYQNFVNNPSQLTAYKLEKIIEAQEALIKEGLTEASEKQAKNNIKVLNKKLADYYASQGNLKDSAKNYIKYSKSNGLSDEQIREAKAQAHQTFFSDTKNYPGVRSLNNPEKWGYIDPTETDFYIVEQTIGSKTEIVVKSASTNSVYLTAEPGAMKNLEKYFRSREWKPVKVMVKNYNWGV